MKFIAVDYQGDFAAEGGKWYMKRACEQFISEVLIPYLRQNGVQVSEIISDYRLPRPSETLGYCIPGTRGYESILPDDIKTANPWIKSMNSPVWIRDNAGLADKTPGFPFSAPDLFSGWLNNEIGPMKSGEEIVIFGLTLDCCVLSLAQELYYRGYNTHILYEAVDTYTGQKEQKDHMFDTPLPMWAKKITWENVFTNLAKNNSV